MDDENKFVWMDLKNSGRSRKLKVSVVRTSKLGGKCSGARPLRRD